jgi:hypothetical protein
MDQVGLKLPDFFSGGPYTALKERPHPAGLRDDQTVEKSIGRNFFRRLHGLADAADNVSNPCAARDCR